MKRRNFISEVYLSHPSYSWQQLSIYTIPVLKDIAKQKFNLTVPSRIKRLDLVAMIEAAQSPVIEENDAVTNDENGDSQDDRPDKVRAIYALSLEQRQKDYKPLSPKWHQVVDEKNNVFAGLTKAQRTIVIKLRDQGDKDWVRELSIV